MGCLGNCIWFLCGGILSGLSWVASGVLLGMLLFRHKTRHLKFMLGVPLMLLAQLALLYHYCA